MSSQLETKVKKLDTIPVKSDMHPTNDNILILATPLAEKTASGIILPFANSKKSTKGRVIAAGPGKYEGGVFVPTVIKAGDVVLYSKYSGTELEIDGEAMIMVREHEVLAQIVERTMTEEEEEAKFYLESQKQG